MVSVGNDFVQLIAFSLEFDRSRNLAGGFNVIAGDILVDRFRRPWIKAKSLVKILHGDIHVDVLLGVIQLPVMIAIEGVASRFAPTEAVLCDIALD